MSKVFNWQIGREMDYRFEQSRPLKQGGAVFDTNKCIACQTCTMACKTTWTSGKGQEYMWWNNVESKPWGAFPLAWDAKILDMLGPQKWEGNTYAGETIFESAPAGEYTMGYVPPDIEYAYPNRGEDEINDVMSEEKFYLRLPHDSWFFYLPRICNHCTYPACLGSCPRTAIYKRPEDGIVLVDQERCRGYRECVRGCPYKKPFYNHVTRVSEKCVLCYPAVEKGIQPRCMRTCIGKIRTFGFVSTPDAAVEDNPIDFLVHVRKVALPLFPQLGLEPNIYYIPPIHVGNIKFLKMLFGPNVEQAIATYKNAMQGNDPELLAVLMLNVSSDRIMRKFKLENGIAIAYNESAEEIVRVPLKEPTMIRPFFDETIEAYRYNVT